MQAIVYGKKKRASSLGGYLRARRSTLIFCGLFLLGMLGASIIYTNGGDTAETLHGIIVNSFGICAQNSLWQLWQKALMRNICLLIFLYFCANCRNGALPASLAPIAMGLASGARITVLLGEYGYSALKFCILGIVLPKTAELLIVLGIYNAAVKQSRGSFAAAAAPAEGTRRTSLVIYALWLAAQALLEGWLVSIL